MQQFENEIILDDIINFFEYLVDSGVPLIDAYNLIVDKFGEEELIKHLHKDKYKNLI